MGDINDVADRIRTIRPALDALRFFTATTRGFRQQEQLKLAKFLTELADLRDIPAADVVEWLKTKAGWIDTFDYRQGDTSAYLCLLQRIPPTLLVRTRDYAMLIAGGSGRRPISDELRTRIDMEFAERPVALPPPFASDG